MSSQYIQNYTVQETQEDADNDNKLEYKTVNQRSKKIQDKVWLQKSKEFSLKFGHKQV
jgi:hypothetical protein